MGFTGFLTIVFIVLKLTGYIAWSWLWVVSPMIIGVFIFLVIATISIIVECRKL